MQHKIMYKLLFAMLVMSGAAIAAPSYTSEIADRHVGVITTDNALACDDPNVMVILAKGRKVLGDVNFIHYAAIGNCMELEKGTTVGLGTASAWKINPASVFTVNGIKMVPIFGLKSLVDTKSLHQGGIRRTIDVLNEQQAQQEALTSYVRVSDIVYQDTGLPPQ